MNYPCRIVNELDSPVRGATVNMKGYITTTGGDGYAVIKAPKFNPDTLEVKIEHPKYASREMLYSEIKANAGIVVLRAV